MQIVPRMNGMNYTFFVVDVNTTELQMEVRELYGWRRTGPQELPYYALSACCNLISCLLSSCESVQR